MPDNLPQHTFCAGPGVARSHKTMGGLLGFLISSYFKNGPATIILTIMAMLAPLLVLNCFGILPMVIAIVAMLQDFLDWYYHERLLCVKEESSCAVGTVVRNLNAHWDGDRKLDILLAPFTENECYEKMSLHINENSTLLADPSFFNQPPFHTAPVPNIPNCDPDILDDPNKTKAERRAERNKISDYLFHLKSKDPNDKDAEANIYNNVMVGFLARLLDDNNVNENGEPKNFQGHFYRKDNTQLDDTSPLWDAIPPDFDPNTNWLNPNESFSNLSFNNPYELFHQPSGVNPLFRLDRRKLTPFLHCEIDGKYLKILLPQLMITITTFGITYTMACMILTGILGPWGMALAGLIAAIIAALIFGLQYLLDGGKDAGDATEPNVDFDDPDNFGEDGYQQDGDLVAVYGQWIMDTEHTQKFEIHPVRAYYVMGRNADTGGFDEFDTKDEFEDSTADKLINPMIDRAARDEICRLINAAEEDEPPVVIERSAAEILSHGAQSYYAGGRLMI